MDRYRITYWHWGRSADKQRRIPTHVRYIDASWWPSSAERSGISISLCPRVFWHWTLLDRRKSLHSLSRCLWCTRITILPSSNSSWVRFKKVISSPGFDTSSMEIAYFDCSEGTSCFITASRLPTMSKSSTWTIKKHSPCLLLSMLGCASSSVISSEHSLLGQLCTTISLPGQDTAQAVLHRVSTGICACHSSVHLLFHSGKGVLEVNWCHNAVLVLFHGQKADRKDSPCQTWSCRGEEWFHVRLQPCVLSCHQSAATKPDCLASFILFLSPPCSDRPCAQSLAVQCQIVVLQDFKSNQALDLNLVCKRIEPL